MQYWIWPTILTVLVLGVMFRPLRTTDMYGLESVFRIFYLAPLFGIWALYFALLYFFG